MKLAYNLIAHTFFFLGPLEVNANFIVCMFLYTVQGLQTSLPYVIGVYMVRDFLKDGNDMDVSEEKVGELTGVLGACFCAAQLFTSYPIGRLSDVIGRKPVIVFGNMICVISTICLGLSRTYLQAILSRIFGGLFNAIIGAEKSIIGETLSRDQQSIAMGHISMTWGVGMLLGPALGGFLARPCRDGNFMSQTELCSDADSIFQKWPFLAPCLAASFLSLVAFVLTACFLNESRGGKAHKKAPHDLGDSNRDNKPWKPEIELFWRTKYAFEDESREHSVVSNRDTRMEETQDGTVSVEVTPLITKSRDSSDKQSDELDRQSEVEPWYRRLNVLLCLAGYAIIAFTYILLDEVIPIFASSPSIDGGLGWETATLAGPLSFGGLVLILWALFGYPPMTRKLGPLKTCRIGISLTIPMILFIPSSSLLISKPSMWTAMALKSITGVTSFTPCLAMVNLVAPKNALGEVNGVGQTLASAVRAIGPALGGIAWSLSIKLFEGLGLEPFGHQFLPFGISVVAAITALLVYSRITLPQAGSLDQS